MANWKVLCIGVISAYLLGLVTGAAIQIACGKVEPPTCPMPTAAKAATEEDVTNPENWKEVTYRVDDENGAKFVVYKGPGTATFTHWVKLPPKDKKP